MTTPTEHEPLRLLDAETIMTAYWALAKDAPSLVEFLLRGTKHHVLELF